MSRFPEISPNDYSDEQNELAQKVAASRGAMRGPFVPALHSPGILRAIEAIRKGEAPRNLSPAQAAIYNFCVELNGTHTVSDDAFQAVASRFGTRGVMDLIGINGHYSMISMILNVAQVPTPDGSVPLQPLKHNR